MPADRPLPANLWSALRHPWVWRMAWRDSRTQRKRLVVFSLSIIAGISALVAMHSLEASARAGIDLQAKALLGSDLQISSRHPFPAGAVERFTARATRSSREIAFSTMAYFPTADAARLVEVRGIEGGFPFYGTIETSPPNAWARLRAESGILVEPALLDQFHARIGDRVKIGQIELPILGSVTKAPPRTGRMGGFSPEAYVRLDDLERTGLLGSSSLALYSVHLMLADPREAHRLRTEFPDTAWHFETPKDRSESLGKALDNFQQYLGLMAIVALVLGAIGVASAVDSHIRRRTPVIAILRCLGCPRNLAFAVYLAQAAALGLLGAAIGALLGVAVHSVGLAYFHDKLPIEIDSAPRWFVAMRTASAGFAVCCSFALLPLVRVRRISPVAMLRDEAPSGSRVRGFLRLLPLYLLPVVLLVILAVIDTTHRRRAVGLTAGLCVAFVLLAATAKGLVILARKAVRPSWPYLLRQGISNLYRPRNQTLLFLLSLGLGTFLLVTILLAKNLIIHDLSVRDLADSPNIYLVDVQPDQLDGVTALIRAKGLPVLETAPIFTMRIQSVKGVPARDLEKRSDIPKWLLQREFRSSYREALSPTEKLAAGTWISTFAGGDAPAPLSLDEEIAKDLHVVIGDDLELDVQGVPVRARVASLRKIDWSRFNLNFFMIFPRGVLESAPGFDVVTTRVPAGGSSGELQRALVQQFPNVSAIDLTLILQTVRSIVDKISRVVSILGGVTVFAGLPILIGTLLNGRDERIRESVLLRTLGASSAQIRVILLFEYAALGALSALAGVLLAIAANFGLAKYVFEVSARPDLSVLALACVSATLLSILAGFVLSRGVSRHPPLQILRQIA